MTIKDQPNLDAALAAAIDIGSNAMRLRICGLDGNGNLETIHYHREAVRLGLDAFTTGKLSEKIISDTEHAFQKFREIIDRYHVNIIRAVATSALRDAKNSANLVERIQQQTGIHIEIISGDEEAQLIHTAIQSKTPDFSTTTSLLIDIGGGSVEVTLSEKDKVTSLESYKAGTVRLIERFRESKDKYNFKLLKKFIHSLQQKVKNQIADKDIDICIGTGGNIECLGELGMTLLNNTSADVLSYDDLKELCNHLTKLSHKEREKDLQLRPDRADVIIPACLLLKSIMKLANPAPLTIPKVGLAEGILIDLLSPEEIDTDTHQTQALAWASTLAKKFHADLEYAQYVQFLACKIFDDLAPIAKLDHHDRLLLQISAKLHEIGKFIRIPGHNRHAHYIINASAIIGIKSEDKRMIASIIRYQRKRLPEESHHPFCQHDKKEQQRLLKLTSILRLAIALNKERKCLVKDVQCSNTNKTFELRILDPHILNIWNANKECVWFETAFNKKLCIKQLP